MSLNIMYSQCFRYYGVNHRWETFAKSCGSVLYEMHQAGYSFTKLHGRMCRFFRRYPRLYADVHNIEVYQLARVTFEQYSLHGSPLLDQRNAWCGFPPRVTALSEIKWRAVPKVD